VKDAIIMNVDLKRMGKKSVVYLEENTGQRLRYTVNSYHLSGTSGI
jgi:hypothetical protein